MRLLSCAALGLVLSFAVDFARAEPPELRAGAYAIDISPTAYPVIVNGMFTERTAEKAFDPLQARCLVLASGDTRLAIVVVDSCGVMREYLDEAKELASKATGIPTQRILISATHTHSAPSAWPVLGSRVDVNYVPLLIRQIARGIELAQKNLAPAEIGWGTIENHDDDFCRRWITRTDKRQIDPFGEPTVHAMMHPGFQNPDYIGPSGPIDPDLTILSIRGSTGRPIAVLANYSMHYFGSPLLSADYFGLFAAGLANRLQAGEQSPAFVGIMSQGTSGDSMWRDYGRREHNRGIDEFSRGMVERAMRVYEQIAYQSRPEVAMIETTLTLGRRTPSPERLAKSAEIIARLAGQLPQSRPEVYAWEQQYLHDEPRRELKLQVIRIGEFGIAAWPNEVFNLTGLKLKARSPLPTLMNIELANGTEGYIPPPEQHALGGYTTWPARSAGLEVQAEPKISERLLVMLEQLAGRSRRAPEIAGGSYVETVLDDKPWAYWRLNDMDGLRAADYLAALPGSETSGAGQGGEFEGEIAFYLPGPVGDGFDTRHRGNRATHFAGGSLKCPLPKANETLSVELWFWNGMPYEVRDVAGDLLTLSAENESATQELIVLSLAGRGEQAGKLRLAVVGDKPLAPGEERHASFGRTAAPLKAWQHVMLTRDKHIWRVYLNGATEPEIQLEAPLPQQPNKIRFAKAGAGQTPLEGKLDELAVYHHTLSPEAIAKHFQQANAR